MPAPKEQPNAAQGKFRASGTPPWVTVFPKQFFSPEGRHQANSMWSAGEIITRVNRELATDNATLTFVTLFLGIVDPGCRNIDFSNAGHNDPYRLGRNGVGAIVTRKGIPLGIKPDACYETTSMPIEMKPISTSRNRASQMIRAPR